ncbi:MAG: hypothetical protein FWC43_08545 [Planctomycetaceae bacterium]|nr:hypothetical protein [Planctomycetaceae bacterium]
MSKAIVLFSGGLDSLLTVRVLQQQEIEVVGLHIVTPFHDVSEHAALRAGQLGIKFVLRRTDDNYLKMIAAPRFGYGKALNPCIDCRIEMCRFAKQLLEEEGADFVATGEIAGQRPNSQKQHQLALIARESGLGGKLLRPLSAKVLAPTTPENEGLIDRKQLCAFTGRGRIQLFSLARKLDVGKIPQPSTGCLLCEKSFAPRLEDLFKYCNDPTGWDIEVLGGGRQIRISPTIKCAMGRNEANCLHLQRLFDHPDAKPSIIVIPENFNGPTTLFVGAKPEDHSPEEFEKILDLAGALTLRFTNPNKYDPDNTVALVRYGKEKVLRKIRPDPAVEQYAVLKEMDSDHKRVG